MAGTRRRAMAVRPGDRHRAREAALRMLYQCEVGRMTAADALASYPTIDLDGEPGLGTAAGRFARALVVGTEAALGDIDPLIAAAAEHWRLDRMAVLDRLLLRMAVYELRCGDSPAAVVINEALELARAYSGEEAVGFVNGVLDAVRRELERGSAAG